MKLSEESVLERIYEAAFVPDLWPAAIDGLCALTGSATGAVFVLHPQHGRWGVASEVVNARVQREVVAMPDWSANPRTVYAEQIQPRNFVCINEVLPAEVLRNDPFEETLNAMGVGFQCCATAPMPSGEVVVFTFERNLQLGAPSPAELAQLDGYRGHLARAAMLAGRIEQERLQASLAAVQAMGLPAAALSRDGQVLATNPAFEGIAALRPAAFGRLNIANAQADALFHQCLQQARDRFPPRVLSIPVPAEGAHSPLALHLVPVRGTAQDFFARTAFLLVVMQFGVGTAVPSLPLLSALFDLTPREAQLAAALASGQTLKEAAASLGMTYSTARTHLEPIFAKTGVRQQSHLVMLMANARVIGEPEG